MKNSVGTPALVFGQSSREAPKGWLIGDLIAVPPVGLLLALGVHLTDGVDDSAGIVELDVF